MNKVDIAILILIGTFGIVGYYRGVLGAAFKLIQWIAIVYFSILLTPFFSQFIVDKFKLDIVMMDWLYSHPETFNKAVSLLTDEMLHNLVLRIINVLSIIIVFILLKVLFSIIFSILNKITQLPILNEINKIGGVIAGIAEGIVITYLLMLLINWLPVSELEPIKNELPSSIIGNKINSFVPDITDEVFAYVENIDFRDIKTKKLTREEEPN